MNKLKAYINSSLATIFFSIFLPLFAIASMIILIKLSTATAVIQINALEMLQLYLFVLPEILFFTLPITFFIASTLTLFKFSTDNEMVVVFSLGVSPNEVIKRFITPALFLSLLMMFNFLIIYPHSNVLSNIFTDKKRSSAKLNLSASEFGHKFGEWLVYLEEGKTEDSYGKVVLFKKSKDEEILIEAKETEIVNNGLFLKLKLTDGKGYSYSKNKFTQVDFKVMYINNKTASTTNDYQSAIDFWTSDGKRAKKDKKLVVNTLLSLFPLLSLFLVATIGIVHERHQKSRIYLYIFAGVIIYYGATMALQKVLGFYTLGVVSSLWIGITYYIYRRKILARF